MSSLTEQERIGLEEVFLSISPANSIVDKWLCWSRNFNRILSPRKRFIPISKGEKLPYWGKNRFKNHKITKLFNKIQKKKKNLS